MAALKGVLGCRKGARGGTIIGIGRMVPLKDWGGFLKE